MALLTSDATLLRALERSILTTATHHAAPTRDLWQTVPGMGTILRLGLRYDIHARDRCPRGQDCASPCRLVQCANASAGKRLGTSGQPLGNAPLQGAFAAAATLCRRHNAPGPTYLARLEQKPAKGQARPSIAHTLARAVYDLLRRKTGFDLTLCRQTEGAERVRLAPHWTPPGSASRKRARRLGALRLCTPRDA